MEFKKGSVWFGDVKAQDLGVSEKDISSKKLEELIERVNEIVEQNVADALGEYVRDRFVHLSEPGVLGVLLGGEGEFTLEFEISLSDVFKDQGWEDIGGTCAWIAEMRKIERKFINELNAVDGVVGGYTERLPRKEEDSGPGASGGEIGVGMSELKRVLIKAGHPEVAELKLRSPRS